jgi:homoserine O-acetyltransferase/O-succinyltransferase
MGSAPLQMQKLYPTRDAADAYLSKAWASDLKTLDANDFLYLFSSPHNYDPSKDLRRLPYP